MITAVAIGALPVIMDCRDEPGNDKGEIVMPGLEPGIQGPRAPNPRPLDCRVGPGNDVNWVVTNGAGEGSWIFCSFNS